MIKIDYNKYTKLYRKYEEEKKIEEQRYRNSNNINISDSISSKNHPVYFEIMEKWDKEMTKLDEPILKNAYYKIGAVLKFVKRNTYHTNIKRLHLLEDKKLRSYTLLSEDDEFDVVNQTPSKVYYENVVSSGIVTEIKTSGDGSGEILYCFEKLNPSCPESNPYCLEKDVITFSPVAINLKEQK